MPAPMIPATRQQTAFIPTILRLAAMAWVARLMMFAQTGIAYPELQKTAMMVIFAAMTIVRVLQQSVFMIREIMARLAMTVMLAQSTNIALILLAPLESPMIAMTAMPAP